MKNINKIILIILLLVGSSAIEAYSKLVVKVKIARLMDCRGFGVCFIYIWDEDMILSRENEAIATADINQKKQLTLTFNKFDGMSPAVFEKYFSKGFFICEDDYPFPNDILKAFNYDGDYIIPAGKYPVTINKETITVVF